MLTRRHLLLTTAAGAAATSMGQPAEAATPANILVMAKAIDSIVGAFDPAESYETANNEACGNIYRKRSDDGSCAGTVTISKLQDTAAPLCVSGGTVRNTKIPGPF